MVIQKNRSTTVVIDGRQYLYFGGTNYLSLAQRPELYEAGKSAFENYGFSSSAGRLTSGETDLLMDLEKELASFASREDAVTFPAGYMSNLAVVEALDAAVDVWVIQPHAHGSIRSAISTSRKPIIVQSDTVPEGHSLRQHCNLDDESTICVFLEPINPLTGEITDPRAWMSLLKDKDFIVLDEAHSFGVLGSHGAGACELYELNASGSVITTGTFSKALGSFGGFVTGTSQVVKTIKERSNSFRGSTPLSPVACGAALQAIRLLKSDREGTLTRLQTNIKTVNDGLAKVGYADHFEGNQVPIYRLPPAPNLDPVRQKLLDSGIFIPSFATYYATGTKSVGLRWTIQAGHTAEQLNRLLEQLG